ncbi:NADH-quinone oxidoreductase subunit NuoK [Patulibacter brassicae]|jgi:NADH-quinone oxidoreductase subunit K|uniref:NADH-quinone oxidoreductase subunit K n=1 Tax=Patulibacter brassicae TaxID=1705717 RepID=A0ABU4VGS7_9ACTN|nr:NADH-quinone oxidoreductase subunit NuoK [Patulibacter brassicae]MDX8151027.1 NADH-quinone oxidoreductase subunit NuoK [Patulibacter brassicae]
MDIGWYLAVSAIVFAIGAAGVITRRNPLLVLLCLELMLGASSLALLAFAKMHGNLDGHVFALVVIVVAAAEVAVGLGIVVALYRNKVAVDVDELRELHG